MEAVFKFKTAIYLPNEKLGISRIKDMGFPLY
ncbi:uncharacterized protein G2W53_019847 [Senna tora]|uniref:Uncharacterized protein n=1 Tax=Senna tora TaxID=362788 RepID=A0A834TV12_9FABA|nr:uncharacterized protein G2W53_019847 [Senna tora]